MERDTMLVSILVNLENCIGRGLVKTSHDETYRVGRASNDSGFFKSGRLASL